MKTLPKSLFNFFFNNFYMITKVVWSQHNNELVSMIDTTGIYVLGIYVFIRYCKTMFDNWHDCNQTANYVTYRCVIAITEMQSLHYPPPKKKIFFIFF